MERIKQQPISRPEKCAPYIGRDGNTYYDREELQEANRAYWQALCPKIPKSPYASPCPISPQSPTKEGKGTAVNDVIKETIK
ncbi:MAG: hypothetical protein NZM26_02250 [Patescibacteria group bacterium]|nr:hypothetical protein [Patescibacteria group bacterium]